ncbi:GyrI-like domain-containing protein [Methanolobus sp. WCC4]|uniref:GyrI-like domain-containing protein n=1 Tax=Methanolobus sp. WCC4 TaxID=3125784 RepID=UPI0030F5220E
MESRIKTLEPTKLIGMHLKTSLAQNRTVKLWQSFMPGRMEIPNRTDAAYISMNVYPEGQNGMLSPTTIFDKWAAVEVSSHDVIPDGMEAYTLQGGKYAVFIHKGPASAFPKTMQYIFGEWLPNSEYELDGREHFEILSEDYDRNDPEAEEEVWVPIR